MSTKLVINGESVPLSFWTFPGGERNVRIDFANKYSPSARVLIECIYKGSDDLVDLILLVNALRQENLSDISLSIPYFPFARQDRVMTKGEANALQAISQVFNMLNLKHIEIFDPHSDVLEALFPPGVLSITRQWEIWGSCISAYEDLTNIGLVSPDTGALKKIYKLADMLNVPVVCAQKVRDVSTGKITSTTIDVSNVLNLASLYVVDDICDGGRTFIELAKAIRSQGYAGKLVLCVTHGIFSQGLEVLEHYDTIRCHNNLSGFNIQQFNNRNNNV